MGLRLPHVLLFVISGLGAPGLISAAVYAALKGTTTGTLTPPGYTLAFYNGTFGGNSTEL